MVLDEYTFKKSRLLDYKPELHRSFGSYRCAKSPLFMEDTGKKAVQQKAHKYICDFILFFFVELTVSTYTLSATLLHPGFDSFRKLAGSPACRSSADPLAEPKGLENLASRFGRTLSSPVLCGGHGYTAAECLVHVQDFYSRLSGRGYEEAGVYCVVIDGYFSTSGSVTSPKTG
ncbi:hypothetical protein E5288_WYG005545 [Bos mutus]|uniref:Uncharacterized protein n=1 Tax=Bos mutus TaxID=72004 RepID=A0A6B0RM69_9CETA|nr:hypothetical protein [Bos mutus]